jgi:hypothetical protein
MAEKTRVQFDFTPEALQTLDRLKGRLNVSSRADVIRYALRILDWVLSTTESNAKILVEKDARQQEIVFPFLRQAEVAKEQPAAVASRY